jgi:hypothetical protein
MGGDRALTDDANKTGIASWRKQMLFWGVFGVFFCFLGVGGKPLRPHSCLFVGTACLLVDECALTLWQRTKKQQFCVLLKLFTLTQNEAI